MQRFRRGDAHVLVATDVAARGLDVQGVDVVVNYSLGGSMDTYASLHPSPYQDERGLDVQGVDVW
jgi:late competence protein required for DNA uptake (superfamily II DNA/RNA helicase)